MKRTILLFICLGNIFSLSAQISVQLPVTNIIGTMDSVDDDANQPSTTVNTKTNVFDNDLTTYFASYDPSNTWVGLDLGKKHVITKIAYCPRPDWQQRLLLGVFEGSNHPDFGDAVILGMITAVVPAMQMTEQTVDNSRGFRYVRYVGPYNMHCNIAELTFYGYLSDGNDNHFTQTANIPDVIIHTVDAQDITTKTTYIKGIVSIVSEDGSKIFTDSLEIRGRGNASWDFEKKPYRMKLTKKARLLDFPAEARNWTLINSHSDKTLIRHLLAFDLSRRVQMPYTPAGRLVNVYLNGEYKGCYQLCDHIDVRPERVDVKEMKNSDLSGANLTGGYLIEIDAYYYTEDKWFLSNRKTPVTVKSPDSDEIADVQFNYITRHFNLWETSIYTTGYADPINGFRKYMDTYTFIRHFLVGELAGNMDTYWSVYLYKQRGDDKFYFGPVWDFDLAFENDRRIYPACGWNGNDDWLFRRGSHAGNIHVAIFRLLSDPQLMEDIKQTYADYRDWGYITEEKLLQVVDNYAMEIDRSQQLNFTRWDILNQRIHQNNPPAGSYSGEINAVKKYIQDRLIWLDKKLAYVPDPNNTDPGMGLPPQISHIRAWVNNRQIHLDGINDPVRVEIINLTGQTVEQQQAVKAFTCSVPSGAYLIRITFFNGKQQVIKCLVP
ncbi:MAG: CotH kinase family protein [Dysgonamonadaceae bacterium]|jgi:hypothetical protein|nr:CotH kinase family protein [Dysgonamonadaceae bacterium]